jgi:arylsulfatase A-like enzyme
MNRRQFLQTLGAALPAWGMVSCSRPSQRPAESPNILWLSCEDIGPDLLGCYGNDLARTPALDALAQSGLLYQHAYATAPICSPARSCLITGMVATSLGTQHLRSQIPRSADIPCLPELLREQGYYCTNNSKTDYNFDPTGIWDENGSDAHWKNRPAGRPFFSVFNSGVTHEGPANRHDESVLEPLQERTDPDAVTVPVYFPDTPEFRRIWARYYDLVSVWDKQVAAHLAELEEAGLLDNTIVFAFGDHGFGLPRYKRWLYKTGLLVPLIVHVPEKYRMLSPHAPATRTGELVSFVDFAPTVLALAGATIPEHLQGKVFLGQELSRREFIFGARSRADDVYDVARCVMNRSHIYIRHYMSHLPYVQDAIIFGDQKRSYAELQRLRRAGELNREAQQFYESRPFEELYDLEKDPQELNNVADDPAYAEIKAELSERLREWILQSRDTGFLIEAEMMIRSHGGSPYDMARDPDRYDLPRILEAAEKVNHPETSVNDAIRLLKDNDSGVRFWGATALLAMGDMGRTATDELRAALDDESPSVSIVAAETLCHLGDCRMALPVLTRLLADEEQPWVMLQAARSIANIGTQAKPILPEVRQTLSKVSGKVWGRYKDWYYSMFTGFALDQTLINCGFEPDPYDR